MMVVPYTAVLERFRAAPPGKLFCLHGTPAVFRMSLTAAGHALAANIPMTLIDGTNRFDVYYLADFARRFSDRQPAAKRIAPEVLLNNIFISRAFTCFQMEAVITDRLPGFVRAKRSPVVIIFGLLDTFYDEQAPFYEVKASIQRIIAALRALKQQNVSVLLASLDIRPASEERRGLFPIVAAAMDRVYEVTQEEGRAKVTEGRLKMENPCLPVGRAGRED